MILLIYGILSFKQMWHDVGHSLYGCVCGCHSENPFVCFGEKHTQRAFARDLPRDRKEEGRKTQRTVSRRKQQSPFGVRGQSSEGQSAEGRVEKAVDKDESRAEKKEEMKSEKRLLGPVDLQRPG